MAKYVCDFDQVISAGDKLCSTASDMTTAVSNYATKVTSDLSTWTGSANTVNFTATGTTSTTRAYVAAIKIAYK